LPRSQASPPFLILLTSQTTSQLQCNSGTLFWKSLVVPLRTFLSCYDKALQGT
jgi:hypothetical protein